MVRVTEAAALMASSFMGRADKEGVDQAAVDAMRGIMDLIDMRGTIVIGEGEKDKAPMLAIGEKTGKWNTDDPEIDIAVDPIDGTTLVALGRPNAISVIATAEKGTIAPLPTYYSDKLAVGKELAGSLDIDASPKENLRIAAAILGVKVSEITVAILERERNNKLIEEIRRVGARIKLISAGDIAAAISTAIPESGIDIYMGIGGSPEGVLAAAAMRSHGGGSQMKRWPTITVELNKMIEAGVSQECTYSTYDLIRGEEVVFSATGVTDGSLLKGVRYDHNFAITDSLVMRSSTKTVRRITAYHNLEHKTITTKSKGERQLVQVE